MHDTKKESELLREIIKLTVRRSMIPSVSDSKRQWEIWGELFELTQDPFYSHQPLRGTSRDGNSGAEKKI